MTLTKNYYTSSNYETINSLPSRDDFHRFASNLITLSDFDTDHTNQIQIDKVDNAIKWTMKYCR